MRILTLPVLTSVFLTVLPMSCTATAAGDNSESRLPAEAVSKLDVADGLELRLFAAEPMLLSPSNIDVDHLGRVWVCEVVNYRKFANAENPERAEGDRILVLEDTDQDGVADRQHTFYQGRDVDSAHGVCVLGERVIVSAGDSVFSLYDDNGDLKADRKEVLFTGISGTQHDHGIHSFLFGPDGRLYFNFGNSGQELHRPDGSPVKDLAGNVVRADRKPYQEGMAFRCELDGSDVDTLGWNFRNNWELCVDSFGGLWQSDNDDDGNRGVRINFLMEYGNYGYKDEFTGAGWRTPRSNLESEIPLRHWHLNDPGVVPNLLQTGAGSPTGILIYEGDQLPERFRNQLIHCDAGPNVVRSYSVSDAGAGYRAEINNLITGERDQWFRPSDVCVAPDGSLIVADWYDPGVGGHRQGDVERGRLFRVSLPGKAWSVPKLDLTTVEGAIAGLKSPNLATRYLAFRTLRQFGATASSAALMKMFQQDANPRFRARALWVLGQFPEHTVAVVRQAIGDSDKDLRMAGLRMARRMKVNIIPIVEALVRDPSPQVRRECAVALRHCSDPARFELWQTLAQQYDTADRWYLEALGLAAEGNWEQCLGGSAEAFLASALLASGQPSITVAAASDLVWRSRATDSAAAIASLIERAAAEDAPTSAGFARGLPALFRALHFQPANQMQQAVMALIRSGAAGKFHPDHRTLVLSESLQRLDPAATSEPEVRSVLQQVLADHPAPSHLISLVGRFRLSERYPEILKLAQTHPSEQSGIEAITLLLELQQQDLLTAALRSSEREIALATVEAMGNSSRNSIAEPLLDVVADANLDLELRRAAVRAAARVNPGAQRLLQMAEKHELDADLIQAAAAALHASGSRTIREAAFRQFPLPPSRDNLPTPPIGELTALKGDVTNGRLVFFTSGTCHKCHVVGQMGRDIGPNLTEIGSKLSREAMFESILFPNAGISHNFETWTVVLTSGTTINGLLTSQTDDSVSIKGDDALVRTFARSEIDELVKQKISLMPADLQKAMSVQEMADVVAFMQTLKKP